jgi:hypothetical protein
MSLSAAGATVTAGQAVALTTTVRPALAGTAVTYQWLDVATWKTLGTGTLNSASQHAISITIPKAETYFFRVVLPAQGHRTEGQARAYVTGVPAAVTPPAPPTPTPGGGGPAVYEAGDTPPGGYPNGWTIGGYSLHGGTNTCSYGAGIRQMTVTEPSFGSDGSSATDYFRDNFWTYDPSTRQWTYLSSGHWNAQGRALALPWYDLGTGERARRNYEFTPGYYYGVTQSFIDGVTGQQYEMAVPFLVESNQLYACRF